ncbi:MAG TPA: hypothetical protein VFN74_10205 [Chloroflexota bacterium]|nr:hypothetical protein [Chloroflexota bacterium]
MSTSVLRRLSKAQLLASLRRETAAPFHVILWDNTPVRLAEALTRLERAPEDAVYYANPNRVFSAAAQAQGPSRPQAHN